MLALHHGRVVGKQCHSLVFQFGQVRICTLITANHTCFLCLTDNSSKTKEYQYRNKFFHVRAVSSCLHGKVSDNF